MRRGGSHAALRICVDSWRVRLRCPLSPSFVLRRDSGFLDTSTVCASCCARAESSRERLRCRWLGFKKRRGNDSCAFTTAHDASGSAVGAGSGVGEVQQCPSSDHVFAQLCGS